MATEYITYLRCAKRWSSWAFTTLVVLAGLTCSQPAPKHPKAQEVGVPDRDALALLPALAGLEFRPLPVAIGITDTLPSYCPFETRAIGGGYYFVHRLHADTDSVLSLHQRLDKALVAAARAKTDEPTDSVWITHDFNLVIECTAPDSAAAAAVDSVTVTPASATIAIGDSVQLTALAWRADKVVACSGDCANYLQAGAIEVPYRQAMAWREQADPRDAERDQ